MVFEGATRIGCAVYIDPDEMLHFICEYIEWQDYHDPVFPDENCDCGGEPMVSAVPCGSSA